MNNIETMYSDSGKEIFKILYNNNHQIKKVWLNGQLVMRIEYNADGNIIKYEDSNGNWYDEKFLDSPCYYPIDIIIEGYRHETDKLLRKETGRNEQLNSWGIAE
ncbi:hypothetical protein E0W68_02165 [Flavobacterium salilacus subsp. salilacus]|uniref:hypothetical protein n=1 Tax=Flavobacterium TaxID=237 RepID=UPI0010757539|nr:MULTISPECIES: hypothetical protein [Flavobacterium]KAF2520047.1 hypothetical protein E0W68_02165 [Flavobacterium salilacus subsp. salilacus]MBE1614037.1 hypothetical protein [Flavobacterium sp. SaA2.13]